MYYSSLGAAARVSVGGASVLRSALGRFGGTRGGGGGGAVAAPAGCVVVPSRVRSASSTSAASAGSMEQPKQPPQQQDAVSGEKNTRDGGTHKAHWDPMTHSFGEGYSTRADEEGFGGVYSRGDDDEDRPGHPEYDTSQGCAVKEKEKGRHVKDDKHET